MEKRAQIPVGPPISSPLPSYWHNPKSPLANVIEPETESENTKPYDYAIIGSGISGTMTAYNLLYKQSDSSAPSTPPPRIVMLEARDICGGATGRNGGHTKAASYRTYLQHRSKYGKDEALKIARLEYENIVAAHRLIEELGIECDNQKCNTVDLIYDAKTFQQGKEAIKALLNDSTQEEQEWGGMSWYNIYDSASVIKQKFWITETNTNPSPLLNNKKENLVGAFEYIAGRVNAYELTTSILKKCVQEKGLQLCAHTPVHAVRRSPSSSHTQMYKIHTQRTNLQASVVILATNGYTPYLLPSLQSSIVPLRGQITAQRPPKFASHPSVLPRTYSFIYAEGYEYMVARNEGDGTQHVIIGGGLGRLRDGGVGEFGTVDDSRLNEDISGYLKGCLGGYFGAAREERGEETNDESESNGYEVLQEWTGIMGATADGLPFVGEVPGEKGLWVLAGFNGHGMVLCLKSAEALVKMVEGGEACEWFPKNFLITEERIKGSLFRGRTDLSVSETQGGPIE